LYTQLGLKQGAQISINELKRRDDAYRARFRTKKPFAIVPQLRAKAYVLNRNSKMAAVLEHFGLNRPVARVLSWTDEGAREALLKAGYSTDEKIGTLEFRKRLFALAKKDPYFSGLVSYITGRAKAEYGTATESLGLKAIDFNGNSKNIPTEEEIRSTIERYWPKEKIEAFKRGECKLLLKGDFRKANPDVYSAIRTRARKKGKKNKQDQITFDKRLNNYVPGLANLVGPVSEVDEFVGQDVSELLFAGEDIGIETLRYSENPYHRKLACRIRKVARELGLTFDEAIEARSRLHNSEFVKDIEGIKEVGRIAELLVKLATLGALAVDPERDGSIYRNGFATIFNVPLIRVEPDLNLETEIRDEEERTRLNHGDEEESEIKIRNPMSVYLRDGNVLDTNNRILPDLRTVSQKGNKTNYFAIEVKAGFHEINARRLLGRFKKGNYEWWDPEVEEGIPMQGKIAAIMMRDNIVKSVRKELIDDGYRVASSERILCYLEILFDTLGQSPFHKAVADAVPRLDSLQPILQQAKEVVHNPHIMMRGTRTADRKFMLYNLEQLVQTLENMADKSKPTFDLEEVPF